MPLPVSAPPPWRPRARPGGGPGPVRTILDRSAWLAWLALVVSAWALRPGEPVLLALALAPWVEEVLFRRGLQQQIAPRLGAGAAIVVTAVAFAFAHVALAVAGPDTTPRALALAAATLVPALAIGAVWHRTGSLGACVVLHASCNAAWMGLTTRSGPPGMPA